jgi:hypothetical protein
MPELAAGKLPVAGAFEDIGNGPFEPAREVGETCQEQEPAWPFSRY